MLSFIFVASAYSNEAMDIIQKAQLHISDGELHKGKVLLESALHADNLSDEEKAAINNKIAWFYEELVGNYPYAQRYSKKVLQFSLPTSHGAVIEAHNRIERLEQYASKYKEENRLIRNMQMEVLDRTDAEIKIKELKQFIDDIDPDEELWINEGCSDFAFFLNGYGHPDSHVNDAANRPENSLVVWGDQGDLEILSDYGHAYLWTLYLFENFGGPFIQAMVCNPDNGISSINSTLGDFNIKKDFGDLYHDWAVALLIDSMTPGGGRYQLENISFNLNIGSPDSPNTEAFSTSGAPPWGTDYIWIDGDPKDLAKLTFNGVDYTMQPTAWSSDGNVLMSGTGDEIDNWAIFEAAGGGTLSFDTFYDIEEEWDFGFVQVSADGGHTWTSLANEYTVDEPIDGSYPKVIENLPGLTGYSGSWISMSFDLSAYAGQDILIAFRYVTDWAFHTEDGWIVDNVYVDGTLISDCSNTEAFKDITEILPINNDFTVSFVGIKEKKSGNEFKVLTMRLDDVTEDGILELNKILKNSSSAVMLVTFDAPEGFTSYVDYTYDFTFTNVGPKK